MSLDRYASAHASPQGPGDARPTAEQVLRDQGLVGTQWSGKVVLITGGTAGLGIESARVLHMTGAKIFITGRDAPKANTIARSISESNPNSPPVEVIVIDQASLQSVKDGATEFLEKSGGKLNILMTNAGVMACPASKTKDGFEMQFGVNHLAHFLLFQLLKPALLASATTDFSSRVISLSSAGHRISEIHPDNYNLEGDGVYEPMKAYGQSKTANIYMANEIERRYGHQRLHSLSVHPGMIFETGISRHQPGESAGLWDRLTAQDEGVRTCTKDTAQGTATQVWAATARELEGKGGLYLEDLQVGKEYAGAEGGISPPGWMPWIWDQKLAARLWNDSLRMVGLPTGE